MIILYFDLQLQFIYASYQKQQVKNFKKTTTLFSLKDIFQPKLLSSSVIQYKAIEIEFITGRKC